MRVLADLAEGRTNAAEQVRLATRLIVRESTAPAPAGLVNADLP